MKPKILLYSDPHFHNYKSHSTLIDGVNSRFLDIEKTWQQAVKIATKECGLMAITGDMFHVRGRLRPSVFNRVFKLVEDTAEQMPIVMIPGNHDMENYQNGATAIDAFESLKNVYVMRGTEGYANLSKRDWNILGIQYAHRTEDFKDAYEKATAEHNPDIILIHQGIDDFSEAGIPETKITADYLMAHTDAWIFSGHYHTPNRKGKVINIGAPLQHTFGDEGRKRGCWLFGGNEESIEHHSLDAPEFMTITGKKDLDKVGKDFVRIKTKTLRTARILASKAEEAGALSTCIQVEKEFISAHEKTVKISSDPQKMVLDFIDMFEKYKANKSKIMKMYEKICA